MAQNDYRESTEVKSMEISLPKKCYPSSLKFRRLEHDPRPVGLLVRTRVARCLRKSTDLKGNNKCFQFGIFIEIIKKPLARARSASSRNSGPLRNPKPLWVYDSKMKNVKITFSVPLIFKTIKKPAARPPVLHLRNPGPFHGPK